jgi:hypothetical protein
MMNVAEIKKALKVLEDDLSIKNVVIQTLRQKIEEIDRPELIVTVGKDTIIGGDVSLTLEISSEEMIDTDFLWKYSSLPLEPGFQFYDMTTPKEWKTLTEEEITSITTIVFGALTHREFPTLVEFAKAIEAKLREKNTP